MQVKTYVISIFSSRIDSIINKAIKEIEQENGVVLDIKVSRCGDSSVFILILYQRSLTMNGADFVYCNENKAPNFLFSEEATNISNILPAEEVTNGGF